MSTSGELIQSSVCPRTLSGHNAPTRITNLFCKQFVSPICYITHIEPELLEEKKTAWHQYSYIAQLLCVWKKKTE